MTQTASPLDGVSDSGPSESDVPSVLSRAFRLLAILEQSPGPMGLSDIAAVANVPKTTTFRLLGQLIELHAVERRGELYGLGMRLFALGTAVRIPRRLQEAAVPYMTDLSRQAGQAAHLGVLDGATALQVQKISKGRLDGRGTALVRRPLHATALGKALLVQLPPETLRVLLSDARLTPVTAFTIVDPGRLVRELQRVQQDGVSLERDEWIVGYTSVAAPIGILGEGVPAAISVAGRTDSFHLERAAEALRIAAAKIAASCGSSSWQKVREGQQHTS